MVGEAFMGLREAASKPLQQLCTSCRVSSWRGPYLANLRRQLLERSHVLVGRTALGEHGIHGNGAVGSVPAGLE